MTMQKRLKGTLLAAAGLSTLIAAAEAWRA